MVEEERGETELLLLLFAAYSTSSPP